MHSIFIFDAMSVKDLERIIHRRGLEPTAAAAPDWELVFAGASEQWERKSIATLREPRPGTAARKMQLPLRPPRSGLLPEWQLPVRRGEDPDVHSLGVDATVPLSGGTQVSGYSIKVKEREVALIDTAMLRSYLEPTPLRIWERAHDGSRAPLLRTSLCKLEQCRWAADLTGCARLCT